MGWLDNQEKLEKGGGSVKEKKQDRIQVCLPGCTDYVDVNKNQVKRIYLDAQPRLMIIIDEMAELNLKSGIKTEQGKEEDAMRQECIMLIQSLTQLGRSAGVHLVCCTQRSDTSVIPGIIQNNPLSLDTKLQVLRDDTDELKDIQNQ